MLLRQARKICQSNFKPDVIVGVCRGGWVPARFLSDLLCNSNLANIKVECYRNIEETAKAPELMQNISADVRDKAVLVVDEVADSGRTLRIVVAHLKAKAAREVQTATLYYKSHSIFKPDYYERETGCWVIFPWEVKETLGAIYDSHKANPVEIEKEAAKLAKLGVPKRLIKRFLKEFQEDKPC
jgi:hypothetical protein